MGEHEHEEPQPLDVGEIIRASLPDEGPFRLKVRTGRQFAAMPEPENVELLGPLVSRGTRTIIVGDTGHGKTTLSLAMLSAIVRGDELLGEEGVGVGPVLVVDLEQGLRSIKRGLRESGLDERDDVLYASVPDGLALDQDRDHLLALLDVISEYRPVVVMLDPYYKAHRSEDPNAERPIIDLMRTLDQLRVVYGFALILPAHPRKDIPGREGARKLSLHDVAGSGAVTRGAEIVIAIERLNVGYARLRYLKDRDGDLPVGEHIQLLYTKEDGFRIDPKSTLTDEGIEERIFAEPHEWMTTTEWGKTLGVQRAKITSVLQRLSSVEGPARRVFYMQGPPGRSSSAQCYGTRPEYRDNLGQPDKLWAEGDDLSACPTSLLGEVDNGTGQATLGAHLSENGCPGQPGFNPLLGEEPEHPE